MSDASLKTKPQPQHKEPLLLLYKIADTPVKKEPFTYFVAPDVLPKEVMDALNNDFPEIKKTGFLPLEVLSRNGLFGQLMDELEGAELSALMTEKLQMELRDKPKMITVRKWSAANDGAAKIVTALLRIY